MRISFWIAFACLALVGAKTGTALAGPIVRVAVTDRSVESVAVAGDRVLWVASGEDDIATYSSASSGERRRIFFADGLEGWDTVTPTLMASPQRVALYVETYFSGVDEDSYEVVAEASGAVGARRLTEFPDVGAGFERLQDVGGDVVLTTAERRTGAGWTVGAYVRDFSGPNAAAQLVGPELQLAPGEFASRVEARIAGQWIAVLRRGATLTVTVYDRASNSPGWTVALPARPGASYPYDRQLVWDLAEDGTLAVALDMTPEGRRKLRPALGWARPRSEFQHVTDDVLLQEPFVIREGRVTYSRSPREGVVRLVSRGLEGPVRRETGDIPAHASGNAVVASDGRRVVAAVSERGDSTVCILAATMPVPTSQRWRCPSRR